MTKSPVVCPKIEVPASFRMCEEVGRPAGCFEYLPANFSRFNSEDLQNIILNQATCEEIRRGLLLLIDEQYQ